MRLRFQNVRVICVRMIIRIVIFICFWNAWTDGRLANMADEHEHAFSEYQDCGAVYLHNMWLSTNVLCSSRIEHMFSMDEQNPRFRICTN